MTRRSAPVEARLALKIPRGFQGVWEILRAADIQEIAAADVVLETNSDKSTVRGYMESLVKAGYLDKVSHPGRRVMYRKAKPFGPVAPCLRRDGSSADGMGQGQENLWRTMKMLGRFTARELAIHASTDRVAVGESSARSYLTRLSKAGYLRLETDGCYRFLPGADTGPLAPMIMRTKFVFDPNVNEIRGPGSDAMRMV